MILCQFMNNQKLTPMGNKILSGLFFLLFFCQCTNQAEENNSLNSDDIIFTTDMCLPDVADKYVYPILPGTEEWKNLGSGEEIIKAHQIPDDTLGNISTLGLVRSFLDIPMLHSNYHLSSDASPTGRMNKIYPYYNSAQEIINREDAGEALLIYYDAIAFDCLASQKEIDGMNFDDQVREAAKQMDFMVQIAAVEVFFAQPKILENFNHTDRQKVVVKLLDKSKQMEQMHIEGFRNYAALEVIANVMYLSNYHPIVDYFGSGKNYITLMSSDVDDIILFANQFIH